MRKKQRLLDCMRELHDVLEMYLTVSFDEDTPVSYTHLTLPTKRIV